MATRRAHRRASGPLRLDERAETLRRRAQRHARKGECRKAAVALREVVALSGEARSWVALGDMLQRAQRPGQAVQALRQGLWLHRQAGSEARARVVARMVLALDPRDALATRLVGADLEAA